VISRTLLTQRATIEPYRGSSSTGPVYDPALAALVPCRVEPSRQVIKRDAGRSVTVRAVMYCQATAPLKAQDRVLVDGEAYTAAEVATERGRHRPAHLEVLLT
jgi:hypothetical protein